MWDNSSVILIIRIKHDAFGFFDSLIKVPVYIILKWEIVLCDTLLLIVAIVIL